MIQSIRNQKILLVILVALIGCGIKRADRILEADSNGTKKVEADTVNYLDKYDELVLHAGSDYINECSPDTVYPGDTITLKLNVPHGAYLVVIRPDSVDVLLDHISFALPYNQEMKKRYEFAFQTEFQLPVDYTTNYDFKTGKRVVFEQEGRYRIIVCDIWETEVPLMDECEVIYLHRR
jgi:hypothetical protein